MLSVVGYLFDMYIIFIYIIILFINCLFKANAYHASHSQKSPITNGINGKQREEKNK